MRIPLKVPQPTERYSQAHEAQRNRALEQADQDNVKRYGDWYVEGQIYLQDTDGVWWRMRVTRAGKLFMQSPKSGVLDEVLDGCTLEATGTIA